MAVTRVAYKHHRWLSQVEMSGIVFSEPVLAEAEPAGFRMLDKKELAEFHKEWETWLLPTGMVKDSNSRWVRSILDSILGLKDEYWLIGAAIPPKYHVDLPIYGETLSPSRVLVDGDQPVMLFWQVAPDQKLDASSKAKAGWKASPTTKVERLLRETGVEVGLLTNGQQWRLLVASPSETLAHLTWTAQTWVDSPLTLAAFKELLGAARWFAGRKSSTVIELVKQSRKRQAEVADELGYQVRDALRLFVHELDRIDAEYGGQLLEGLSEAEIYEACVTLMMRLLFLLYAEENGLLPHGNVSYDEGYGVTHLLTELESRHSLAPEDLKDSQAAYARLLGLFRLVHEGSPDPDIHVVAHGGRLFDPDRFPILEGRRKDGAWPESSIDPLPVRDSITREMLRSFKYAQGDGHVKQLVSYRTLTVEQIGYMYEGLLDVKLARAVDGPLFELICNDRDQFPTCLPSEVQDKVVNDLAEMLFERTGKAKNTILSLLEPPDQNTPLPDPGTEHPQHLTAAEPIRRMLKPRGIIRPGGLYMTTGQNRRATGTHYTPPELTEPVVRHALEPLVNIGEKGKLADPRQVRKSHEILGLKVCDMAAGSGAFLVQAVRYIAGKLVEAWDEAIVAYPGIPLTMPYAEPAKGKPEEHLMPGTGPGSANGQQKSEGGELDPRAEMSFWAKRYVATNCIYGVDLNHLAVEMAKLSLWLETQSRGVPFTFLDHAIKPGDSLLGVDRQQLASWSLERKEKTDLFLFDPNVEEALTHVIRLRAEIAKKPVLSLRDARDKAKLLQEADNGIEAIKLGGDLLLGSFFGETTPGPRDTLSKVLQADFHQLIGEWRRRGQKRDSQFIPQLAELGRRRQNLLGDHSTFHWPMEFPEAFAQGGFDAIVGNPPFMGGQKITGSLGSTYRDYLVNYAANGYRGSADLCTYFVLKAVTLLKPEGVTGLLATKSISQGDSREVGLEQLIKGGCTIFRAVSSTKWPGKASVEVSLVWLSHGVWKGQPVLDGVPCTFINSYLKALEESLATPFSLPSNAGLAAKGSTLVGSGFVLTPSQAQGLIAANEKNRDVVLPYLIGKDLNTTHDQAARRWAITFKEWPLDREHSPSNYTGPVASDYPDCLAIIRSTVKPSRDNNTNRATRESWWHFERTRADLYAAMEGMERVLVIALTSKTLSPVFVSPRQVIDQSVVVILSDDFACFTVVASSLHYWWAIQFSTPMRTDARYLIGSCFDTYPFPVGILTKRVVNSQVLQIARLARIGETYYSVRKTIMHNRRIGLTALYNRFHDQDDQTEDICRLRECHVRMDQEVTSAYQWGDLSLRHDFCETRQGQRFTIADPVRSELLKRLVALNHERSKTNANQR